MNIFELKIWDDEAEKCTFYTVQEDGASENETDIFFDKYDNIQEFKEKTQELLVFVLSAIGDNHGAIDEIFNRHENEVDGLPAQGKLQLGEFNYHFPNFPLRLYALKISESIVVLFNGGIKDGSTNQTSSLHFNWVNACNYAKRIVEAIKDGSIVVNESERKLTTYDGSEEIIL
ncbi:hypothetical protein [Mangrovimonas futianensis]|uniref:hypothetical protein n=1 Tax=Mangrovimonas futianensis TaxID=2895523 RepID=UPI001E395F2C|nr:hypothetical protein [Mangrovimonas futianensis]MCF1420436.1 hypothetical protein [Mangrovimonas futianensis]